ncbi:MAG: prepilin-type N-terminal cleavage/methylation domain-containing protein [Alphaproteobacteria bacterium]|nr:prepilin-type N-terminal cleavage/methylation domain-containing protein [Alphaproteobacteria bacterium]
MPISHMHNPSSSSPGSRGFTLIEISIVMVIIAIVVGGVLVGNNLLRNARLGTILSDKEKYVNAVEQFKTKYKSLPGDMANATQIWGAENADFTACALLTTPSTTKATCDGDGDDSIAQVPESIMASGGDEIRHEYFRAWQHLANAGLIEGSFSGVNECDTTGGGIACYKAGKNAPLSDLRNTTWALFDMASLAAIPSYIFSGSQYRHVMYYGGENAGNDMPFGRMLIPKEAWNLDYKADDGLPGKGHIMTIEPVAVTTWNNKNDCATDTDPDVAIYDVANTENECMLLFRLPF